MKILFKNITKYDKVNCNNFMNFHKEKYGKKDLIRVILMIIVAIYMIVFNMILNNWILLLGVILTCVFIYFIAKKKKDKKRQKQKNKEFTFDFYERNIKVKQQKQIQTIRYFEIRKIFETEKNFFLYTDDTHSLILDKEGFSIGTSKEFTEFIKKKCPFKYKNK